MQRPTIDKHFLARQVSLQLNNEEKSSNRIIIKKKRENKERKEMNETTEE